MEEIDDIFNEEPSEWAKQVYIVYIEQHHMVQNTKGDEFNKQDYYDNPHKFTPVFHSTYLKYFSVIVNCMYWDYKYQRLITDEQMKNMVLSKESRLIGVCDITCDYLGSIEFLKKFTDSESPFYTYEPISQKITDGSHGQIENGILYHAMDFLPCELGFDASSYFGSQLLQFIPNILFSHDEKPFEEQNLCPEIAAAIITCHGKLTPNFEYIQLLREANQKLEMTKKTIKKQNSFLAFNLKGKLLTSEAFEKLCGVL